MIQLQAPRLKTERLILRAHDHADFDSIFAIGAEAETTRYLGGPITSQAAAWEKFLRGPAFWSLLGYGMWIAERRDDSKVLGQIGFGNFMRDIDPPLADLPEMAWMLGKNTRSPNGRGMGYGSEALSAVLAWGDAHLRANRFQCIISPENEPSMKLALRHGFVEIHRTEYKDAITAVLERPPVTNDAN
jgi:RimJ/RimL family protein N-acetyltransferase